MAVKEQMTIEGNKPQEELFLQAPETIDKKVRIFIKWRSFQGQIMSYNYTSKRLILYKIRTYSKVGTPFFVQVMSILEELMH